MFRELLNAALLASFWSPCHGYFSQGWQPGQPVTKYLTATSAATTHDAIPTGLTTTGGAPVESRSWKDLKFGLEDILTSGPISSALMRFGFNVSERLASARAGAPRFTHTIPLVTDSNYKDLIYHEEFLPDGEKDGVWAILVSVGSQDSISHFFDQTFDGAHNLTVEAQDAKNIRWGRIDYLDVTEITTRWVIWRAPILVIATDRGLTLRFFTVGALSKMKGSERMRDFIVNREWELTAPWSGPWSPRGSRAAFLAKYAKISATAYTYLKRLPSWLLLLLTAMIASSTLQYLHGNGGKGKKKRKAAVPTAKKVNEVPNEDTRLQASKGRATTVKAEGLAKKRRARKQMGNDDHPLETGRSILVTQNVDG